MVSHFANYVNLRAKSNCIFFTYSFAFQPDIGKKRGRDIPTAFRGTAASCRNDSSCHIVGVILHNTKDFFNGRVIDIITDRMFQRTGGRCICNGILYGKSV